jgi:hypothetical protein
VYGRNECETEIELMQSIAYTSRRQKALLQSLLALFFFLFWFKGTFEDIHRDLPKERNLTSCERFYEGTVLLFHGPLANHDVFKT